MVFHGCSDVKSGFGMGVPHSANIRFHMGLYCAPQGGNGLSHVIMLAMDVGIGRYIWGNVGLAD